MFNDILNGLSRLAIGVPSFTITTASPAVMDHALGLSKPEAVQHTGQSYDEYEAEMIAAGTPVEA